MSWVSYLCSSPLSYFLLQGADILPQLVLVLVIRFKCTVPSSASNWMEVKSLLKCFPKHKLVPASCSESTCDLGSRSDAQVSIDLQWQTWAHRS